MNRRTSLISAACVGAIAVAATGCNSHQTTAAKDQPVATPSAVSSSAPLGPTNPTQSSSFTAQQVADTGLPSKIGAGKLSTPTIKRLVQYFEDRVERAYATGNSAALRHYLAGPMLTGNVGTINLLNSQHKRDVYKIRVKSVEAQTNTAHSVILTMHGDMTVDYFFDTQTHKILDNGLPGPSQVAFTVFLDQNPKSGTWYWTGEQSGTAGPSTGAQTVNGQ